MLRLCSAKLGKLSILSMAQTLLVRPADLGSFQSRETTRGSYFIQTWGCQMNEEDSEQIGQYLRSISFSPAATIEVAHVIVLNTCSVRRKPEDKAFSMLGELRFLKQRRPEIVLGVCGCMAQIRADEIKRRAPHVDFVIGTANLSDLPNMVEEALQTRRFQKRIELPERKGAIVTDIPQRICGKQSKGKVKAFVPIQYGCDKFCSFCIVPSTRGRERSRPTLDILNEVASLAELGTKEVTLLGQTVNSYGKNLAEGHVPFSRLLWLLSDVPQLERIRYTSPYPRDFRTDLIQTIRDCPAVMEHVHLPMQHGNDDMLRAMKRQYTRASYLEIVEQLRAAVPSIGLTTDIIVGFPGETEAHFQDTLSLVRHVRFDGAYMFIYSPRPGTPAADLEQVPEAVKKDRLNRLVEIQNDITCQINRTYVGRTLEVLVEGESPKNPSLLQGYSREFKMVHFPGKLKTVGELVQVCVTESKLWGLHGERLSRSVSELD